MSDTKRPTAQDIETVRTLLAFDAGQSIEDAWIEAVRHANTL